MSFSELNRTTRRPLLPSLASADAEFNRWVASHGNQELRDASGGIWRQNLRLEQIPHPQDTQASLFRLHLGLESELDARQLVEVGAFSQRDDARLLSLLGTDKVPMTMKNRVLEAANLESIRSLLADESVNIRKSLLKTDLNKVRRSVISQWIDHKCWFGSRFPAESSGKIELDV